MKRLTLSLNQSKIGIVGTDYAVTAYDLREEEKEKREKLGIIPTKSAPTDQPVHESELFAVFTKGTLIARIDVTTEIQDENFIEIKSGLKPEDIVVIGPYSAIAKSLKSGGQNQREKKKARKNGSVVLNSSPILWSQSNPMHRLLELMYRQLLMFHRIGNRGRKKKIWPTRLHFVLPMTSLI